VVAVAHPDVERALRRMVGESGEQCIVRDDGDFRVAELALIGRFGIAAELLGHRLQAVADAEQRQAAVEYLLGRRGRAGLRRRFRAAGQDDAFRAERSDLGRVVIPGPDFAIDADFADAPCDQLRVLRAEVEDEDLVGVDVLHGDLQAEDLRPCAPERRIQPMLKTYRVPCSTRVTLCSQASGRNSLIRSVAKIGAEQMNSPPRFARLTTILQR
jgi:hypothetical protein